MVLSHADCLIEAASITERFALHSDIAQLLESIEQSAQQDTESAVGGMDAFSLKPPLETPEGKLNRIVRLLNRGEPVAAADKALKMLENNPGLDPALKERLEAYAARAADSLKIMGRPQEALDITRKLKLWLPDDGLVAQCAPAPSPAPGP